MTSPGPRRGQAICVKRKRPNGRTYKTAKLARKEAREHFRETGSKMWIYYCADYPCALDRYIHWTSKTPDGRRAKELNARLLAFYEDQERAGTGTSKQRARDALGRRTAVRRQIPLMTWADDGGSMHPRELED